MGDLVLDSLDIKNFRAFKHLTIERLARVNLIVGANNVGKTSLFEALRIYANRGSTNVIWQTLEARDESAYSLYSPASSPPTKEELAQSIATLFYGRRDVDRIGEGEEPIQIESTNGTKTSLRIGLGWYTTEIEENGGRRIRPLQLNEVATVDDPELRLTVQQGHDPIVPLTLSGTQRIRSEPSVLNTFIPANGLSLKEVSQLWDKTTLTPQEQDVVKALRLISQHVESINFIGYPRSPNQRFPVVKLHNEAKRIPLRSLGEGMNRMFGLALALVNAKDGLLLIDEIDTGLHYSVLPDMWKLVFEVARQLNVQVFATTHSWDCIQAFSQAQQEQTEADSLLLRLNNDNGEAYAEIYDKRQISIATRQTIEVR